MKPDVYTQLYVQLIFAVKYRECLLHKNKKSEICKYISGIIEKKDHKSIIVNGMPDHLHIFIGLNPKEALSDLVKEIKRSSSKYINKNNWFNGHFAWQEGYGAFTYGRSQIKKVYKYIVNQEKQHTRISFREEYLTFLDKFEIDYNEKYTFRFIEI
jgi:REP element-mobilizing transposase RayT